MHSIGSENDFKQLTKCRICGNTNLERYLDLGDMPLVNNYVSKEDDDIECPRYPLQIDYCTECSMSQLSIVVNPSVLFKNYFYRSSVSKTFIQHCSDLAEASVERFKLSSKDLIVDIASNDGANLQQFKKYKLNVLGVDPAENLATIANENGIPTVPKFWNSKTAEEVYETYGKASMITAMNVFAHVDDLDSFLKGVNILLDSDGVFILECPYMMDFMEKTEFDTTYHEHLSYFLLKPIMHLMSKYDLDVFDVERVSIHGGTIRVFIKKKASKKWPVQNKTINAILDKERNSRLYDSKTYENFSTSVIKIKDDMQSTIKELKSKGKHIAAYGASAKGNILSNFCRLGKEDIDYIVDDTPEKQGCLSPGHHIPIVSSSILLESPPDYLLLLAWNFAEELIEKTAEFKKNGGKYIIPIPKVEVL